MTIRRVLLPGVPIPADDYLALVAALPGSTVVLDTLSTPVTRATTELRAALSLPDRVPYELVGHSIGALAALEWAALHPLAVSRVVLLDPADPWGAPVPAALGGAAGTVLSGSVSLLARSRLAARTLGRWGRRTVLRSYGVSADHLSPGRVDELFGTRAGLMAITEQVTGVPTQVARVRALLERGFRPPDIVVIGASAGQPGDRAATERLAAHLGTRVIPVPGAHLFPMTHPEATAAAMSAATTGTATSAA